MITSRRYLHMHPETGFDASGLVAMAGQKRPGRVFLIRADMDAFPIHASWRRKTIEGI